MNFLTDERGKNIKPQNPLSVDNVRSASEREPISGESVTFVTGAAGFTGSVALDKGPIANLIGNGVGSFWRRPDNLLLSTENNKLAVTAVTETATSATVTVSSADYDLEELLEISSGTAKAVIEITDPSGGTLYGYVGAIAESGTSYVIDIYDTPALATQSWVGTLSDFTFAAGTRAEVYRNSSSFAWVTGTVLTQEVDFGDGKDVVKFLDSLSNGQFGIDYGKNTIHYKKATTGTSDTCNYSILKTYQTATISGSVTVDSEFPAAAALADATANPTTTNVGSFLHGFNGTTWDRLRTFALGLLKTFSVNNDPTVGEEYSTVGGDFTATVTDSTNDIVLSVDSIGGATITADHFTGGSLKVTKASDNSVNVILLDSIDWTSATKTLDTSGCTGAFTFATGDVVSLVLRGPKKNEDTSADAQKIVEQSPIWTHTVGDTLADVTNEADATSNYYLDVKDYESCVIQFQKTGGTDTVAFTLEGSAQDDGTADSSCTYQDITQYGADCLTAADAASFAGSVMLRVNCKGLKFLKCKVAVTISASDVDYVIYTGRA